MAIVEGSIDIKCPVDKVFAYTTDVKSWPKWQSNVTEAEQTSTGQIGIGTTFRWLSTGMGFSMRTNAKVTEYELNKRWSKNIALGSWIIEEQLTFDPIEGGTKFTIQYDMKTGGFFNSPIVVSSLQKSMKVALTNIKSILEAGT